MKLGFSFFIVYYFYGLAFYIIQKQGTKFSLAGRFNSIKSIQENEGISGAFGEGDEAIFWNGIEKKNKTTTKMSDNFRKFMEIKEIPNVEDTIGKL